MFPVRSIYMVWKSFERTFVCTMVWKLSDQGSLRSGTVWSAGILPCICFCLFTTEFSYKAPIFGMYKGCYPVDKNGRTVKQAAGDYRPYLLNTYSCRETCSNQLTAFAALQEGDICFCANDICEFLFEDLFCPLPPSGVFYSPELPIMYCFIAGYYKCKISTCNWGGCERYMPTERGGGGGGGFETEYILKVKAFESAFQALT